MIKSILNINGKSYNYYDLNKISQSLGRNIDRLPYSLKILLENLARNLDNQEITKDHLISLIDSAKDSQQRCEISFAPSRVLMQDFTGVPAVVDLAAMRDAVVNMKKDPKKINPLVPVDLVIDHSLQVDYYGSKDSLQKNIDQEYSRNLERYKFLKWAQESFENLNVVPPGNGICHQVNIEKLATIVSSKVNQDNLLLFDTVVGTDSHTTMVNALGVLGWGVGGIEAEAAMLGQPISMLIPEVVGFKLVGKLQEGLTATDLVLNITQILRNHGVVGKFVEFFGSGLKNLSLADRATISNMAPEYGATCGIFPLDEITLDYLRLTNRSEEQINIVKEYSKAQGAFVEDYDFTPNFSKIIELDISKIKPSLSGPKRPQDRSDIDQIPSSFIDLEQSQKTKSNNTNSSLKNGDIVIAAITSCTNTSNPSVLIAAGLIAKKAVELGLKIKPHVKTSLAPGSQVVSEYLSKSGLQQYLDQLGFNIVGFGCATCIGNSGPLEPKIEKEINDNDLIVGAVLSGNRNFEGRIHQLVKANYLASPPLVMIYALAGNLKINVANQSIAKDKNGNDVFLKDIWPKSSDIKKIIESCVTSDIFAKKYANLFMGDESWQKIKVTKSDTYKWEQSSTYIRLPEFFKNLDNNITNIKSARIIALLGDSVTTDHISPAGSISTNSAAAKYLNDKSVNKSDFNSYGSRRGNHEVMMRGTFANIRIKNLLLESKKEGGYSKDINGNEAYFYDAAMSYKKLSIPLVIFAGKEYGTGSSRDWAAKGTKLLGIKAVIAQSFERIHRSNLIGMGVLPLCFKEGQSLSTLKIKGNEVIDILDINSSIKPKQDVTCVINREDGTNHKINLTCRLDTQSEVEYFKSGGILQYVLNNSIN